MCRLMLLSCLCATLAAAQAVAFVSFGNGLGSKWGPSPVAGTPATVTWGYMADGTTADPGFVMDPWSFPGQTGVSGGSSIGSLRDRIDVTLGHGAGAFDAAVRRAFETWSRIAGISFVGPVADGGQPFASAGASSPDIRIGAFVPEAGHSFNWVGAVGFGPPGFGPDPLAGDVLINLNATIDIVLGDEDQTPLPAFTNDLEGLLLHELGHAAIGLGHPAWDGQVPDQRVMYVGDFGNPAAPPCCLTINRALAADDIAGARFTYGLRADYLADGLVNAGDYTVWRDQLGASLTSDDYEPWLVNFGATTVTIGTTAAVPEPTSFAIAGFLLAIRRRRSLGELASSRLSGLRSFGDVGQMINESSAKIPD